MQDIPLYWADNRFLVTREIEVFRVKTWNRPKINAKSWFAIPVAIVKFSFFARECVKNYNLNGGIVMLTLYVSWSYFRGLYLEMNDTKSWNRGIGHFMTWNASYISQKKRELGTPTPPTTTTTTPTTTPTHPPPTPPPHHHPTTPTPPHPPSPHPHPTPMVLNKGSLPREKVNIIYKNPPGKIR